MTTQEFDALKTGDKVKSASGKVYTVSNLIPEKTDFRGNVIAPYAMIELPGKATKWFQRDKCKPWKVVAA
jgi:hypothetical protein